MSKTTQSIWKSRLAEHIQDTRKYLKYMFNDHLIIVLIFSLQAERAGIVTGSNKFQLIFLPTGSWQLFSHWC